MEEIENIYFHAAFTRDGLRVVGTQNHRFARAVGMRPEFEWSWGSPCHLNLETGRFGMASLYCYADRSQVVISPSILPIMQRVEITPDWEALSVFSRLGYFVDNDTPFRNVKVVPPSSAMKYVGGPAKAEFKILQCQKGDVIQAERYAGSRSQAIDDFIDIFFLCYSTIHIAWFRRHPAADHWW